MLFKVTFIYVLALNLLFSDTITFGNESSSTDGLWLARYEFYKDREDWIASVKVYSEQRSYKDIPVVMVQYIMPKYDYKSRDAKFEWKSPDNGTINHLQVKIKAGSRASLVRIVSIDLDKRTVSMLVEERNSEEFH